MMDMQEAIESLKNIVEYWTCRPTETEAAKLAIEALEKQIPKPPIEKVNPKYPALGKMYYCECGVLFTGWGNPKEETNYCGNCGQKLKGDE
jgi:hypothetical protein